MKHKVYIPQSDCECYMMAADLVREQLAPINIRMDSIDEDIYNIKSYLGEFSAYVTDENLHLNWRLIYG